MIRLVIVAVALLFALALVALGVDIARAKLGPRVPKPRARRRSRDYDWERRTDRLSRRAKSVPAPAEDRDKILGFLDSRIGVEAYVEPRTVMHPLSVVLVAGDGEWVRVALRDDAFLRELTKSRGLTVHDAMRTGYPERMRKYRRPDGDAGAGPGPDD